MKASSTNLNKADESSSIASTVNYIKDMLLPSADSGSGKGLEMGVTAILAKTALRRLPPPLNFVVPLVVKNVIVKHGVPEGRELLLKGLRWVKRNTEEKPVNVV